MKITLNHFCHMKGAVGGPGDVVDVSVDVAKKLIARKGATLVEDKKKAIPPPGPPIHKKAIDLATELGVDINEVTGSGANGAITVEDVKVHAELETKPDGEK